MEIGRIRKELTELLDNIMEHSNKYSEERTIPSLEVGAVLTKINRLQEGMAVLRHLLEQQEIQAKLERKNLRTKTREQAENNTAPAVQEEPIVQEKEEIVIKEEVVVEPRTETPEEIIEEEVEKTEPITSPNTGNSKLVDALTLNDRYLYANELFNKDMNAFNELVKAIDLCNSFDEAQKLYLSLDWEIENEHVLSFTNLVELRFS